MKFVFNLDGVICTPPKGIQYGIVDYIKNAKAEAKKFVDKKYGVKT